jgi:hypothetical protein
MNSESESIRGSAAESPTVKKNVVLAIVVGAFIGGTVDILTACIQEGWDIPLYVAAGLLGRGQSREARERMCWACCCTSSSHAPGRPSITWRAASCLF